MSERERIMKLLAANPTTLARVDAILDGTDGETAKADDDCRLVTYTEAAKRLNVSRPSVYRMAKAGRLDIVPLEGVKRIKLKSVIDYINNPPQMDAEAQRRRAERCREAGRAGAAARFAKSNGAK